MTAWALGAALAGALVAVASLWRALSIARDSATAIGVRLRVAESDLAETRRLAESGLKASEEFRRARELDYQGALADRDRLISQYRSLVRDHLTPTMAAGHLDAVSDLLQGSAPKPDNPPR